MCGIVGLISKTSIDISLMLNSIDHRGPDFGSSIEVVDKSDFNIKLGHRRLSIIDVSSNSNQPFVSTINRNSIVFNGEIYNYEELRIKYLFDFDFKSNGDTEVILELYNKYGSESFKWLKGMFAFVIYDDSKNKIVLCRDALGIKPLYYYYSDCEFYFSSEIKAIKQIRHLDFQISKEDITEFFLNGFIYEPNTGFSNILKVFPGSFIEVIVGNQLEIKSSTYWKPILGENKSSFEFDNLINREFVSHLVSDVPVGLFYSGGIDSSVLLSLSNENLKPLFINSKPDIKESNDFKFANNIANSLNREFEVIDLPSNSNNSEQLIASIKRVAEKSEELIADYTFYVSELISKKAKEKGLKVMLSGMGGDELFLGYPRYKLVKYSIFYKLIFLVGRKILHLNKRLSKKIERFIGFFESKSFILRYTNLIGYFNEVELPFLLNNFDNKTLQQYENKIANLLCDYKKLDHIKQAQILDLYGFLAHNFMVADKSSMLQSIELRVPLATPDLFDYCFQSNTKYLMNFKKFKIPLLNILGKKLKLNLFNRPKEGFNPDLENIVDTIGLDKIKLLLNDPLFCSYINESFVSTILEEHSRKKRNNSYRIYQLLYFKFWINYNH